MQSNQIILLVKTKYKYKHQAAAEK